MDPTTYIIIVHGYKPGKGGGLSPQFRARLDTAISVAQRGTFSTCVLSGGATRRGLPSEASVGSDYLKGKLTMPMILEDRSRTTFENVRNVRTRFQVKAVSGLVIMGRAQMARTRALYRRVWPEAYPTLTFVPCQEPTTWYVSILELVYRLGSALDPEERSLGRLFKTWFRNA